MHKKGTSWGQYGAIEHGKEISLKDLWLVHVKIIGMTDF